MLQMDLHAGSRGPRTAAQRGRAMKLVGRCALIVAATIALAGCEAAGPKADPTKVGGTVSLWYIEDPVHDFIDAVKAGFEAKYPGTTVELTEVPEDGYVTKIDT